MPSSGSAKSTLSRAKLRLLHESLLEIVGVFNRPDQDEVLIEEAGIRLDRALFPLLVGIERFGPIGIVDLAGRVGRDYTTVSRQVAKLESLGLAKRQANPADGRMREAVVTAKGKAMTKHFDAARERLAGVVFATWPDREFDHLVRLMGKFAGAIKNGPART